MFVKRGIPGWLISLGLHIVVLTSLTWVTMHVQVDDLRVAIETAFSEDRTAEEFTKELNVESQVAESLNVVSGGAATTTNPIPGGTGGGGDGSGFGAAVSQRAIDSSQQFQQPIVVYNGGGMGLPGVEQLGAELGEGQVMGEVGAAVEGYGPALGRVTQEVLRMMRESRLLVVWLFDESESMKDDQAEIREQFHKVYEELGIAQERDANLKAGKEILLTSVYSFGKELTMITPKPTASIPEIRAAISRIRIDESGKENMCAALSEVIDKYSPVAKRGHRKLAIIVVTDESGDDGELIDDVVYKAKKARSPIYILGREAVFGFPIARIRWKDPKYGLDHWLQINRGPETAFAEAMQFDGLHARWDAHSSGFGPYEQARLAKETGGIFFVLPHEEENLIGQEAIDKRKFAFLDMKEYVPELIGRREYEDARSRSKFRSTIWEVIVLMNPFKDAELQIQEHHYTVVPEEFLKNGQVQFTRALRAMGMLNQAAQALEKIRPLRDKEDSQRWRADYDLILAQSLAYRVRLFQFLLVMDRHLNQYPPLKNPKSNEWNLIRTQEMLKPDARQVKLTKINMEELQKQEKKARDLFAFVIKTHPRTPWSNRAEYELQQGFGMRFVEGFRDPRYKDFSKFKFPTL